MNYSMVATDFDNTLAIIGQPMPERHREALARIRAEGVRLAVVSGRTTDGLLSQLRRNDIPTDGLYLVGYNGAQAVQMDPREILFGHPLDQQLAQRAAARMEELGAIVMVPEGPDMFVTNSDHWLVDEEEESNNTKAVMLDDWSQLAFAPYKVIMGAEPALAVEIHDIMVTEFGEQAEVVFSAEYLVEFTAKGVHKGAALRGLCRAIDQPLDEVVVIGDNHNDSYMFGVGGLSVAVANAVPELLATADRVTGHCADAGVADLLDELFPTSR